MKTQILLAAAILTASPLAGQTLVYQGNRTSTVACSAKVVNSKNQCMMYDNITVGDNGWDVTGLFGNFYQPDVAGMVPWTSAMWEIRTGMSEGNAGTLLYGGEGFEVSATHQATGRTLSGGTTFTEYLATLTIPQLYLAPGTYWIGISPVFDHMFGSYFGAYAAWTEPGASGGINSQADGSGIAWVAYSSVNNYAVVTHDFSYGVLGTISENGNPGTDPGNGGTPGTGPGTAVPEPGGLGLLAAGLMVMAGLRRRRN